MNRKLFFLLVILVLAVSACDLGSSEDDFEAPDEPQVRLASSNTSVDGETVVSCLPQGRDNVVCELGSDNMPAQTLTLTDGSEAISVEIGDELGEPTRIEIESREMDASGDPAFATTVQSGESFTLDLTDGFYLLDVTARYDDVDGQGASVTTSFAVTIGQGVAVGSTPSDDEADVNATATAESIIATATAQRLATEADQQTATDQPDDTPTPSGEDATLGPIELTATFIVESFNQTETAAVESVDEVETATPFDDATEEVTDEPTEEPTEEPTIAPTDTTEPTEEPTEVPTQELEEATPTFTPFEPSPTDTPQEVDDATPTFTPFVPTETPVETAVPTDIPPTATVVEATSPPPPTPTPGEVQLPEGAPEIELAVSGLLYLPASVEYCEGEDCNVSTFTSRRIQARPNNAANVIVPGATPESMRFAILNRSTFEPVFEGTRGSSNVYLFNVSVPNAGLYVLEVDLIYENDITVAYRYQLQVR